jgi:porphobilinogen deaminase
MAAVTAERSLLEALAAGCSAPVAAYGAGTEELRMRAAVMSADGRHVLHAHGATPAARARQLGRDLAAQLLRSGAADLISVNRNGACHMSRTMSVPGWAQQMSTSPSAGVRAGPGSR